MPGLTPNIVKVTERNTLDARGNVAKAIAVVYTVGNHGPFTLITTPDELASGAAATKMQQFAATLATLPGATS